VDGYISTPDYLDYMCSRVCWHYRSGVVALEGKDYADFGGGCLITSLASTTGCTYRIPEPTGLKDFYTPPTITRS